MKLSIVIVNYNVKHFLDQCLTSVRKATRGLEAEVFVVDNNSVDSSTQMVREKYPEIKMIANKENIGFSAANNQAIREAKGEYVLLLNPDTVLEDDTLSKCIHFMDSHPDAGGLGVKMIDGKGNFLPESKRGLPTPDVAFYKIFGLSRLFPRSKIFGKYHLGYLDMEETHEVEVLSGAFMMLRKKVLGKIGLLDESFFMYGEDIDLSYRITQAGFKNYYYPGTRIIHYKGESTKKGSVNYVFIFYNAMVIFARKHFSAKNARMFSALINLAIYFRASLAILSRFLKKALLPAIDFILLYGGLYLITQYWEKNVIFPNGGQYPVVFKTIVEISYALIWIVANFLSGGYDVPVKLRRIFRGLVLGTVFILVVYALLPEHYRFSRAIILLGTLWGAVSLSGARIFLHLLKFKNARLDDRKNKRFIIIGDKEEAERVSKLVVNTIQQPQFIGLVSSNTSGKRPEGFIGTLGQIAEIIMIYKIDELIFCSKNLSHQQIIDLMAALQNTRVDYKIAPEDSLSIIGSNSINTQGDLYTVQINTITKIDNRRNKRLVDVITSLLLLVSLPVGLIVVKRPGGLLRNIFWTLSGRISWVGFHPVNHEDSDRLPEIKAGVLTPLDAFKDRDVSEDSLQKLNVLYARDYNPYGDLNIIWKGFKELGRRPVRTSLS